VSDMRAQPSRIFGAATLLIVGGVAGAAIAQAIREQNWQPIWSVAWLPAVLVVSLRQPASPRECLRRFRRRARS
jgi:hypothetical protein